MNLQHMAEDQRRSARQHYAWARKMERADYLTPEVRQQRADRSRQMARNANARAKRYETRACQYGVTQT
jgi:hypothetical protein